MNIVEYNNAKHYVISAKRIAPAPSQWKWEVKLACLQDKVTMINKSFFKFSASEYPTCPYCKNYQQLIDTSVKLEYE